MPGQFDVIPVLDLRDGQAVWARGGRRQEYQPLRSIAVGGPDPADIVSTICRRFGLTRFYIADLDAIEHSGSNLPMIAKLIREFDVALMVDAGTPDPGAVCQVLKAGVAQAIVGSETLENLEVLETMLASWSSSRLIFSLDTRGGRVLSRCDALRDASPTEAAGRVATLGVSTLIALELQRVGTGSGPDLAILRDVRTAAPGAALIAGGGVRGLNDLSALDDLGCAGALVGTAITTGALTPEALDTWRAARA